MPTYDYRCTSCSHQYEMREGFDAPSRQPCPRCGGEAKRVLYAPPIVFKGSGWYITDSRKGSSAMVGDSLGSASEGSGGNGAKAAEPKASSKPASATSED